MKSFSYSRPRAPLFHIQPPTPASVLSGEELALLNPLLAAVLARFEDEFGPASRHDVIR